jgi:hypothetical protein
MNYLRNEVSPFGGNRVEVKIDEERFANDLAKALGGTVQCNDFKNDSIYVIVGQDRLFVRADNWKKRINVSIDCAEQKYGEYDVGRANQRTESASVSPERPIAVIAKDIKRRVIDASQPALAARRAWQAEKIAAKASLASAAEGLRKQGVNVDIGSDEHEARVSVSGLYLYGRLSSSGLVSIDRIEGVSASAFLEIVKIVKANRKKESS